MILLTRQTIMLEDKQLELEEKRLRNYLHGLFPMFLPVSSENHLLWETHKAVGKN